MNAKLSAYTEDFYEELDESSLASARIYLRHLWRHVQPSTVLDVGCGRGNWLSVCGQLGAADLCGLDGPWNDQSKMVDPRIVFVSTDLSAPFSAGRQFDLTMSLEVAEHVKQEGAAQLVQCIAKTSDLVLFGAAYPGQGGTEHVNEQSQSYWGSLFAACGYTPFDMFRPVFWSDERVSYWYRQNTFLYARNGSAAYQQIVASGTAQVNLGFMECVHPELYRARSEKARFLDHARAFPQTFMRTLRRRLG